jgi:hypothetical protein
MILHVNYLPQQHAGTAGLVADLLAALEAAPPDPRTLTRLRVHLDWIQYRRNFRDPVTVRRAIDCRGAPSPLVELAIDVRQATPPVLAGAIAGVFGAESPLVPLEPFGPLRSSIIWTFNNLFWQHLPAWEAGSGRSFEQALPAGRSDATHEGAIADSVADFWTLIRDLDARHQLPPEVFILEIGVGTGARVLAWLDRFRQLDAERGTGFYPRLRILLSDYSTRILDRVAQAVRGHQEISSFIALDALNPFKTLSFLRYKVLYIHLANVYDNLPNDEMVRKDGRFYAVEARAHLRADDAAAIAREFDAPVEDLARTIAKFLEVGPDFFADRERGVRFWQTVWAAVRLEERLVELEDLAAARLPTGLTPAHIEDCLQNAPAEVRFHLSTGAVESLLNTVPLLHPRGYLQAHDIFVTSMDEYRQGFRGPGKLDGSVVNWVNGALLREVGVRAGYDVHFAPFHYRPGSHTKIMYTTQRD